MGSGERGSPESSTASLAPHSSLPAPFLEVISPGLLTTVQDPRGRPGWARYGVASGGALDPVAAEAANRLVGNDPLAAVLEMTLAGPTVRIVGGATAIGLAGADLGARIDGRPLEPGWSWLARNGSIIEFGASPPATGARAYLAFAGGLRVRPVLGSSSTDLGAGFGGVDGRPIRAGDRLELNPAEAILPRCGRFRAEAGAVADPKQPLRVLPGAHLHRFASDAFATFCATEWRISQSADRMGYRLEGPVLPHRQGADVASLGLPLGAIQVPANGQPIVLLVDRQPTGGYAVLACVIRADLPSLAQRRPGDTLRFVSTSVPEARAALAAQRAMLQAGSSEDLVWDAIRWA